MQKFESVECIGFSLNSWTCGRIRNVLVMLLFLMDKEHDFHPLDLFCFNKTWDWCIMTYPLFHRNGNMNMSELSVWIFSSMAPFNSDNGRICLCLSYGTRLNMGDLIISLNNLNQIAMVGWMWKHVGCLYMPLIYLLSLTSNPSRILKYSRSYDQHVIQFLPLALYFLLCVDSLFW